MQTYPDRPRVHHPLWGGLFGLVLGLGVLLLLLVYGWAPFSTWLPMLGIVIAGVVVGVLVGVFAPARRSTFW